MLVFMKRFGFLFYCGLLVSEVLALGVSIFNRLTEVIISIRPSHSQKTSRNHEIEVMEKRISYNAPFFRKQISSIIQV